MQFELIHNTRQSTLSVKFNNMSSMKLDVLKSFYEVFHKIGGESQRSSNLWIFPSFITSQVISEIIRNTCFICGGLMTDGKAFDNTYVSFDDFGNDAGKRGSTQSKVGPAKIVNVRKCTECGHSHT